MKRDGQCEDSNLRRLSHRVYSPAPLTTWVTVQKSWLSGLGVVGGSAKHIRAQVIAGHFAARGAFDSHRRFGRRLAFPGHPLMNAGLGDINHFGGFRLLGRQRLPKEFDDGHGQII